MNNKAKIKKLQAVVDSSHVSESVKEQARQAILNLHMHSDEHLPKAGSFQYYLGEVYDKVEELADVTRSDAQGMVDVFEASVEVEFQKKTSASDAAKMVVSGDFSPKSIKKPKKGGVKSIIKGDAKDDHNCDEILAKFRKKKLQSKRSQKKIAVKEEKKEKAHEKFPELDALVSKLASEVAAKINSLTKKIESKMPYKAQYVLEELIKDLKERV